MKNRLKGLRFSGMIFCGTRQTTAKIETAMAAASAQSGGCQFNREGPARPITATRRGGPATAASQVIRRRLRVVDGSKALSRMKKVINTGTMVIATSEEAAMANV